MTPCLDRFAVAIAALGARARPVPAALLLPLLDVVVQQEPPRARKFRPLLSVPRALTKWTPAGVRPRTTRILPRPVTASRSSSVPPIAVPARSLPAHQATLVTSSCLPAQVE